MVAKLLVDVATRIRGEPIGDEILVVVVSAGGVVFRQKGGTPI